MKKLFISLIVMMLLSSCLHKDEVEEPEDIVSNVVEVENEAPVQDEEEPQEEVEEETASGTTSEETTDDQAETENTQETTEVSATASGETSSPEEEEIIKDFEAELDSLFDLLESDEG